MIMLGVRRGRCAVPVWRVWVGVDSVGWTGSGGTRRVFGTDSRCSGRAGSRWRRAEWWSRCRETCCGSVETDSFGGVPGAVQPVQARGVADQPHGDGTGAAHHHGGDEDEAFQEAAELHPDVFVAVG